MSKLWTYPVTLRRERDGQFHAYSDDLPEAIASGSTLEEAQREMTEAFAAAVRGRMTDNMDLPLPRRARDKEVTLYLTPGLAAKASIYSAWKRANITKAALAERMNRSEVEVRRILDPYHGTKIDQLAEAAEALGGHLAIAYEVA